MCVVFVGGKAVPADQDFPGCNGAAGESGSEMEDVGTADPVHKGNNGSDEGALKPPKRGRKKRGPARKLGVNDPRSEAAVEDMCHLNGVRIPTHAASPHIEEQHITRQPKATPFLFHIRARTLPQCT
ncbi:hypothetical protein DFH07DRAFT_771100 [Mycena maculata]|uniref:Uncharacterized protein n=1 Tax=Mycena maculata TaxID=230809 RepID=A0AAD7JD03_9AGAR|nr:hypothetical protein DFH07DRAFT_771100 [Mycena maculata]